MPNLQVKDVSLFYEVSGQGAETVAFLNGVAMSTERWAAQTPFFSKNYHVLLHDFRGQGRSTLVSEGITFETHARDMAMLLDTLGIHGLHIVGVSYGAEVGMYFALMYPERVKSLTLGTAVSESDPFGLTLSRQKKEMSQTIFILEIVCSHIITNQSLHFVLQSVLALFAEMNADNIGGVAHSHVERACGGCLGCFYCHCVLCHAIPP